MDWFSWLSKTGLEPSLSYEYGLLFARNELQEEDLAYLNHEVLQSMGISVAKHRLEILKLARKEVGATSRGLAKLFWAISKTRKRVTKYFGKKGSAEEAAEIIKSPPEAAARYRPEQWKGALTRYKSDKDLKVDVAHLPVIKTRTIAKSGPLDGRMIQDKMMITSKNMKLSGPLDRKVHDRLVFAYRSPKLSGPLDGRTYEQGMYPNRSPKLTEPMMIDATPRYAKSPKIYTDYMKEKIIGDYDDHSLWAALFQDLKPT